MVYPSLPYYYWLYFEHCLGSHIVIKILYFSEKKTTLRYMKGVENLKLLDMDFDKVNLRPILSSPKVLATQEFPNIGPGALPQICLSHIKFGYHFPLGYNFKL